VQQIIGNVYIIAAASGTGKTSLVKFLIESLDDIAISISHTTRPMRKDEREQESYFYVSEQEFKKMIDQNAFLEYAKVFDHYYGTSKEWVEWQIKKSKDVILEIDWQGAQQIKQQYPQSISIFILPPSKEELRRRLESRNQDNQDVIAKRLAAAHEEIAHCSDFDYIVINDKFDIALVDLRSIIRSHRMQKKVQIIKYQNLLAELIKK
jgi:guanylate kinase